jgi:hypothetical protein
MLTALREDADRIRGERQDVWLVVNDEYAIARNWG